MKYVKRFPALLLAVLLSTTACSPASTAGQSGDPLISEIPTTMVMPDDAPSIDIQTAEGQTISYESALTLWNGKMREKSDLLPSGQTFSIQPARIAEDESLKITFSEPYPDEILASSMNFSRDASSGIYLKQVAADPMITSSEISNYSILFSKENLSGTSSEEVAPPDSDDPYKGTLTGCFLSVQWGENICEYAFLVAFKTEENIPPPTEEITDTTVDQVSSVAPVSATTAPSPNGGIDSSSDPDTLIRARFRALGMTFHEAGADEEQKWINYAKTDFQSNGVAITNQTVQYIVKINDRSFTINYPGTTSPVTPNSNTTPSTATTGVYSKPYDTNAIIDDLWVYAKSKGFWLDTSLQKDNSSWNNPVKTAETNNLGRDLYIMIDMEVERGVGNLNIVAENNGNGEYTFYFFA